MFAGAANPISTSRPKKAVGAKEWIDPAKLAAYADSFEYAFQWIKEKALYMPSLEQMHYFTILGADIDEFNRHNPVTLSQGDFQDWNGFNIIVGKTYANVYHLKSQRCHPAGAEQCRI